MGLIYKEVEIQGNLGRRKVKALFDTGASSSFIRKDIAEGIATISKYPKPLRFFLGDGENTIETNEFIGVILQIKDINVFHSIIVVKNLGDEFIVGSDLMQRWKIKLDPKREDLITDKKVMELKLVSVGKRR